MKKKLLISGLALGLTALTAINASAVVDLDADTGTNTFATEIDVDAATGTTLANPGNIMDATVNMGFGADAGFTRYFRFDLNNGAEFAAAPSMTLVGTAGVISAGGAAGDTYVIFSWTAPVGTVTTDDVSLFVDAAAGVTVYSQDSVTMSFAQYETAGNAVAQTSALASESGVLLDFGAALVTTVTAVTPDKIDVTQESKVFDSDGDDGDNTTTQIANLDIGVDGTTLWTDGEAAAMADLVAVGTELTLSGDFSGTQDLTDGVPDGTFTASNVYIDNTGGGCNDHDVSFDTLTATTATYAIGAGSSPAAGTSICIDVNGVSALSETTFTGLYDVTAAANSDVADVSLGTLSSLEKNGSTDRLTFALTPEGAYPFYLRVVNPSTIAGKVYLTVVTDDGTSETVDLSGVANVDGLNGSGELPAGASTNLVNLNDIFDATSLSLAGTSQKLRVNVEAEFGSTGYTSGVVVNAFSLSTDGTTFNVVK
jgi:hypothetical protein